MKKNKKAENNKLINIDIKKLSEVDEITLLNKLLIRERERIKQPLATYERCMDSKDSVEMSMVAKTLGYKGMGRNNLFEFLRDKGIFRKGYGVKDNEPYQEYVDAGWFEIIIEPYIIRGEEKIYHKIMTTAKGMAKLREMLDEYFSEE